MAIQQSINSAFNSLLAAAYTGTKAFTETEGYKRFTKERSIRQSGNRAAQAIKGIIEPATDEVGTDLTQVENVEVLDELVKGVADKSRELVLNNPSAANIEAFHKNTSIATQWQPLVSKEITRRAGLTPEQAALEAQQREQRRIEGKRKGMEERERMLGGENN